MFVKTRSAKAKGRALLVAGAGLSVVMLGCSGSPLGPVGNLRAPYPCLPDGGFLDCRSQELDAGPDGGTLDGGSLDGGALDGGDGGH